CARLGDYGYFDVW
nr:immunoglobulin heavy chain junction region [Mus musculus]